jgi:hypothetical protein
MNLVPADHVCPVIDALVDVLMGFALVAGLDAWYIAPTEQRDDSKRE